jgi:hypothetical protein
VLGATILSVIGPDLVCFLPEGLGRNVGLTLIAVTLLLIGFGLIQKTLLAIRIWVRNGCWDCPRIGILRGVSRRHNEDIPMVWSDITPGEWVIEMQAVAKAAGKKVKTKLIYATQCFDSYNAIINPFGGSYPEVSFDGFPVYNKLLAYIRRGGFFVNVADIPTYWGYNPRLKRLVDRTPAVYTLGGEQRLFHRVPLMQEFALRVRNVEKLGSPPWPPVWPVQMAHRYRDCGASIATLLASRAVIVEGNVEAIIEPTKVGEDHMTPLFFCPYGEGRCLISLSFLNGGYSSNSPLKSMICKLVIHQLTN